MIWCRIFARRAPTTVPPPDVSATPSDALDLLTFDALDHDGLQALTKRVRRAVIADRKAEMAEALKTGRPVRWAR